MIRGGLPVMFARAATSCCRLLAWKVLAAVAPNPPVVPGGVEAQPSLAASVSLAMSVVNIGPDPGVHAVSCARAAPVARPQDRMTAERDHHRRSTFMGRSSCGKVHVYTRKPVSVHSQ